MRILYLNHNVAGTGTYQRAFHLARELVARGHHVTLVTTSAAGRFRSQQRMTAGVSVIEAPDLLRGPARNGWDPWNALWRTHRLAANSFDLIHAFDARPAVIIPALAQRWRNDAPFFLDWADWWGRGGTINERSGWAVRTLFGPVETWFEEHFRVGATGNSTISEPLRQRCIALGAKPDRVVALPNGCELPRADAPARQVARARLGVGNIPLLVHLGVTQPADADFLFEAFAQLRSHMRAARLVLIGNFRGSVPAAFGDSVQRTGYVSDAAMRDWLAAADIGVIPLRDTLASRARWPGKINEYLTAGLPVVLPRIGPAAEYISGACAGVVCDATPASFARAMQQAIEDGNARTRMSESARALAVGRLAWPRIADEMLTFYTRSTVMATPLPVMTYSMSAGAT